jgi:hypothetical protein
VSPGQTLEQQVLAKHPAWSAVMVADVVAKLIAKAGWPRPDAMVDREHLTWIAQHPRAELDLVLAAFKADGWYLERPRAVTPKHIRGKWSAMLVPATVAAPAQAHTMSEAVAPVDERQRRIDNLRSRLRDERALLDAASDVARPHLQQSVARLQAELEQLTTRAA